MFAAAQERDELIPLSLAQLDPVPYVHRRPPKLRARQMSHTSEPCLAASLHAEAGAVSGLHPCLHAGPRPAASPSRPATPLSRHAAIRAPDAAHARALTVDPARAGRRRQHRSAGPSRRFAAPTAQPRSTSQNRCAGVLVRSRRRAGLSSPRTGPPPFLAEIRRQRRPSASPRRGAPGDRDTAICRPVRE
jgi:hypothetical protein